MAFSDAFYLGWQSIAIAAASFSVIGSVILIMLSRLLELRNLEQVAKTEFTFAASTILIVLMAILIFDVVEPEMLRMANFMYFYSLGLPDAMAAPAIPGTDPPQQVETLIDYTVLYMATPMVCVEKFMDTLYLLSIPVEAMASVYMEIFMSEQATGFGFKYIAERITNSTQMLTFYTYVYYLLIHVLNFVKYYAGFFFSLGVVLRAFPPTRGGGAYMMALSMGMYFVFPLTYILISAIALPYSQANIVMINAGAPAQEFVSCALPAAPSRLATLGCGEDTAPALLRMRSMFAFYRSMLSDLLTLHFGELMRHMATAMCIFPMVSFVVLMTFVLNTTSLFGGNIPEIGRGLVRLI